MAVDFNVQGPCLIETDKTAGSGTLASLGFTPNDQLIGYTVEHGTVRLTSSRGGTAPLDAIYTGSIATIDFILEEFDMSEWTILMRPPGVTVDGKVGTPGTQYLGVASGTFILKIQPVLRDGTTDAVETVKSPATVFPICFIDGPQAGRLFDMGNESTKAGLSVTAIANSNDELWTLVEA